MTDILYVVLAPELRIAQTVLRDEGVRWNHPQVRIYMKGKSLIGFGRDIVRIRLIDPHHAFGVVDVELYHALVKYHKEWDIADIEYLRHH